MEVLLLVLVAWRISPSYDLCADTCAMGVTTRSLVIVSSTGSKGTVHGYEYDPVNNFCFVSLDLPSAGKRVTPVTAVYPR